MRRAATVAALLAAPLGTPALAQTAIDQCTAALCKARVTGDQLLAEAQALVTQRRFDEARPMLAALASVPGYALETRFLTGYIAAETGDHPRAASLFRAILTDDPAQTRVRLELARSMLAMGKTASADHHFRLAAQAEDLPPEIAATIRTARGVIRSTRAWSFNLDLGVAPDTNINNATSAENVTLQFGETRLPVTLSPDARATSGTGQTAAIAAGARLPLGRKLNLLFDLDAQGNNYDTTAFDDVSLQLSAGPEFALSDATTLSAQATGAQRWYGGGVVSRQAGLRLGAQTMLGDVQRLGLLIDARRTDALFDPAYDGWQLGGYATYERVIGRSMIASLSLFARRDALAASATSSTEYGLNAGIGGELAWGFNAGLSGGLARVGYDAANPLFSLDPRRDVRLNAKLQIGNRKLRVFGFSPSVTWSWARTDSSIDFYKTERSRIRFGLARYF